MLGETVPLDQCLQVAQCEVCLQMTMIVPDWSSATVTVYACQLLRKDRAVLYLGYGMLACHLVCNARLHGGGTAEPERQAVISAGKNTQQVSAIAPALLLR
jgi:hypothetical protein